MIIYHDNADKQTQNCVHFQKKNFQENLNILDLFVSSIVLR